METADLIRSLADDIAPVRPLRPPLLRAALWLCAAAALMGLLIALHGVRPQFAERMAETGFMIGVLSSLATGILAAIAAFMIFSTSAAVFGTCQPFSSSSALL